MYKEQYPYHYYENIYKPEICHVSMKIIHAEIGNGIISPREKLDIDDKDVLIRIEDAYEII